MSMTGKLLYVIKDGITPEITDGGAAHTLLARDYKNAQVVCLMDQGGKQMSCEDNKAGTLRAEGHGHQPIVLENHPNDSRVKIAEDNIVQTLHSGMGTGGGKRADDIKYGTGRI